MHLVWSPDSKYLLFADKFMRLHLVDVKSGKTRQIARSDYDDAWERWGIQDYTFLPDTTFTLQASTKYWLYADSTDPNPAHWSRWQPTTGPHIG
jgi:tricorn protease-like protein